MSPEPLRMSRKEFSSTEVLDRLDEGQRVIVSVELFGSGTEVVLRKQGETYICDTGLKLLRYEERTEMRRCIERLRLTDASE